VHFIVVQFSNVIGHDKLAIEHEVTDDPEGSKPVPLIVRTLPPAVISEDQETDDTRGAS
jgi:hypothetical protein